MQTVNAPIMQQQQSQDPNQGGHGMSTLLHVLMGAAGAMTGNPQLMMAGISGLMGGGGAGGQGGGGQDVMTQLLTHMMGGGQAGAPQSQGEGGQAPPQTAPYMSVNPQAPGGPAQGMPQQGTQPQQQPMQQQGIMNGQFSMPGMMGPGGQGI
jgi:hypothetical protein